MQGNHMVKEATLESDSVGRKIAHSMQKERIEGYLNIARETITKSKSAIVLGSLIFAFGLTLRLFLNLALTYNLLGHAISPSSITIAQLMFALIGIYLILQGLACLREARTQALVMERALHAKMEKW